MLKFDIRRAAPAAAALALALPVAAHAATPGKWQAHPTPPDEQGHTAGAHPPQPTVADKVRRLCASERQLTARLQCQRTKAARADEAQAVSRR